MVADARAPLFALRSPAGGDVQTTTCGSGAGGGEGDAADVERAEGHAQALAFAEDDVFARDANVVEMNHGIVKRAEAHEPATADNFHARRVGLHDEGGDRRAGAILVRRGRARHDDEQAGLGAIGAPKFFAVDQKGLTVFCGSGGGSHARGIAAHIGFGEGEGADFTIGTTRQETFLLSGCAKHHEGLRDTDGLVRRQQGGEISAETAQAHGRAAVVRLRKPQSAIAPRNLDAKGSDAREGFDDAIGDLALAVNGIRIHSSQDFVQMRQKRIALIMILQRLRWKWHDLMKIRTPQKQGGGKAAFAHGFARGFGGFQRGALAGGHL